jgi:prepilin-type processing-associated H-X9-DG protein
MHQIGIALHIYTESNDRFPPALVTKSHGKSGYYNGFYSIHARLLAHLDQSALFNSINFQSGTMPTDVFGFSPNTMDLQANPINSTVYGTQISEFLCPSDGFMFRGTGCNYRGNTGIGPGFMTWAETPDSGNGVFPELESIRPSGILDGLSHTVSFSERIRGSGRLSNLDPNRDVYIRTGIANTADQVLKACRIVARPGARGFATSGQWWFWSGRGRTLYTHGQEPNGAIPDCSYGNIVPEIDMATARSNHPNGVNALMADGSTRFFTESIQQAVWRGFGTRNGGELVD